MHAHQPVKSTAELRKFGFVMTVPFALLAGWFWWKGKGAWPWLTGISSFFLFFALVAPGVLRPVEKYWMKLAEVMSAIMTRVILALAFYLLITPFGLLLKVLGKELLSLKMDRDAKSYWVPVEEEGPGTRPDKPY